VTWFWNNLDLVWSLSLQHIALSIPPIVIGFLVAIPLGWLAHHYRVMHGLLLTVVGLLYTIPSIALLVILPPLIGIRIVSAENMIIVLSIYVVAIMVQTTADALDSVDPGVKQAATAMGFSPWRRFWGVELPLAGPVLLAGLRVAAVSTVSLVTVGILVGVQSLGYLFTNGLQRGIEAEIITGIVGTVVIALIIDRLLVLLGTVVMPWTRTAPTRRASELPLTGVAAS
jgi:osmoprotectant transport system permease protein